MTCDLFEVRAQFNSILVLFILSLIINIQAFQQKDVQKFPKLKQLPRLFNKREALSISSPFIRLLDLSNDYDLAWLYNTHIPKRSGVDPLFGVTIGKKRSKAVSTHFKPGTRFWIKSVDY